MLLGKTTPSIKRSKPKLVNKENLALGQVGNFCCKYNGHSLQGSGLD